MFRQMRRFKQQLTKEECIKILTEEPRGTLAVLGDEGYPYAVPLNHYYEDGRLYFHSAKTGHKVDAIKNYSKVSYCVLNKGVQIPGKRGLDFKSVICFGKMHIVEEEAQAEKYIRRLGVKYFPEYKDIEIDLNRVQCYVIEIEHITGKAVNEA